jgi:hypothetical protein
MFVTAAVLVEPKSEKSLSPTTQLWLTNSESVMPAKSEHDGKAAAEALLTASAAVAQSRKTGFFIDGFDPS